MNRGILQLVATRFIYPPSPQILQWLASGQLANRLQRSVRLWVLLTQLYGTESHWAHSLPKTFKYANLRDRLFSSSHPKSDRFNADQITTACPDITCICHRSLNELVFTPDTHQSAPEWQQEVIHLTGLSAKELEKQLQQSHPFATVHRSVREDLKQLCQTGWLASAGTGKYQCRSIPKLPTPPVSNRPTLTFAHLSESQTWELLRVLESVSFVQPNLEVVVRSLWEQVTDISPTSPKLGTEPQKRIFLHLDYILSPEKQESVDTYQEQLESLWHRHEGGIVQFKYWMAAEERKVQLTLYPVCLHYVRRAKYMSAYGIDPKGEFGWHNYRLDRIASKRLTILAWGDPSVPKPLKELWHTGQLPTSEDVESQLEEAWGFDFYLPRELLILRFPPAFARWYVDNTERHPTFEPIAYKQLRSLIAKEVSDSQERQQLLEIVKKCSPEDAYYRAWIRTGDINVIMRLRDWRPNGEVIAPLSIRERLKLEATQELANYEVGSTL